MVDTGDIVGGVIGLGIGLIALDTVRHISHDITEDRDREHRKKAKPKKEENYFRI